MIKYLTENELALTLLKIVIIFGGVMGGVAYLSWLERKLIARVQMRPGPNRVGPFGLLQPIADGLKFLFKEDIIPRHVDKLLYLAAPAIAVSTAFLAFAVVPFGSTTEPPNPHWPQNKAEEARYLPPEVQERVQTYNTK